MKKDAVCPICCVGKNSKKLGGNHVCFHCDTCGWVACNVDIPDGNYSVDNKIKSHLQDIEKRLREYYDTLESKV